MVSGTTKGTTTNNEGKFGIDVDESNDASLAFSFVDFVSQLIRL